MYKLAYIHAKARYELTRLLTIHAKARYEYTSLLTILSACVCRWTNCGRGLKDLKGSVQLCKQLRGSSHPSSRAPSMNCPSSSEKHPNLLSMVHFQVRGILIVVDGKGDSDARGEIVIVRCNLHVAIKRAVLASCDSHRSTLPRREKILFPSFYFLPLIRTEEWMSEENHACAQLIVPQ